MSDKICEKLDIYCRKNNISITDENFQIIAKEVLSEEEYLQLFLPDEVSEKTDKLAIEGDVLFMKEKYIESIEIFKEGLDLIPEPKENWEASLWFLAAIGDAHWFLKDYDKSLLYWNQSLNVVEGKENLFVRFRRGQVLFELYKLKEAFVEFQIYTQLDHTKALFMEEDEKYLNFFQECSEIN